MMIISTFIECLYKEQAIRICNCENEILYSGKKNLCPKEIESCKIVSQSVLGGSNDELIIFVK